MLIPEKALLQVNTFFDTYARALKIFDTKALASFYVLPCLLTDDSGSIAYDEASRLEGLFNQGTAFYRQYGIAGARADVWNKQSWSGNTLVTKVNWQYFGEENEPLYNCDYRYLLRLDKGSSWKIQVSVSVNERQRMEAWLKQKNDGHA